jgi:PucR family transcriptional regulator, purine catabolism regulatory protein
MITVRDLIEQALPTGASVVAGQEGLDSEVTWATRPRPTPPAFGHLSGGELVLLTPKALSHLDERLTLESALKQLVGFGVAAVAYAGRAAPGARHFAESSAIPLVQLPADSDLAMLERETSHFITERRREAQRRSHDASRRLMEMAIAGESLADMARALTEMSSRGVIIEGRDGRILAAMDHHGSLPVATVNAHLERSRQEALTWLRGATSGSLAEPPTTSIDWNGDAQRVIAPIMGRDGWLGVLSLLLSGKQASAEDALLASRGAAACAIVLAREHAAATARQELELNVLDEVLDGALRSEVSLLLQAKRLGHDLEASYFALVARIDAEGPPGPRHGRDARWSIFDETLNRRRMRMLWRLRHNQAEIVWPAVNPAEAASAASDIFQELSRRAGTLTPPMVVSMGVGRVRGGAAGIRQSHQEAKQALTMSRRLHGPGRLTNFDDLGIYRLIFAAQDLPELRTFHDEALTTLIEYDRQHGAELIKTLSAFFAGRCGPKEAASILGVHRNTVLYRLDRIRELTKMDLDDADVRLRLHLALSTHTALYE